MTLKCYYELKFYGQLVRFCIFFSNYKRDMHTQTDDGIAFPSGAIHPIDKSCRATDSLRRTDTTRRLCDKKAVASHLDRLFVSELRRTQQRADRVCRGGWDSTRPCNCKPMIYDGESRQTRDTAPYAMKQLRHTDKSWTTTLKLHSFIVSVGRKF